MRFLSRIVVVCLFAHPALAQVPDLRTRVVLATFRLEHPKTKGTSFVVDRPDPKGGERRQLLLVTAAHAFERMDGDRVTLVLRERQLDGWKPAPRQIQIRHEGKPAWQQHAKQDVAVLPLGPVDVPVAAIPLEAIATAEDWQAHPPEPGSLVRCIGFPHAEQFKPSAAGFPLTRLGCIASYPLATYQQHPTFLVDFNVFEGDSGGPVYSEEFDGSAKIVGLVHGQHFLDERYKLVYQEGMTRKRLGLAIIVNSQAILETIAALP